MGACRPELEQADKCGLLKPAQFAKRGVSSLFGASLMDHDPPPPKKAGIAALLAVATLGAMILAIFVGFNLYHADTQRERQSGHVDQRDLPKSPTDLQVVPPRQ
jgi:hypothetical protein